MLYDKEIKCPLCSFTFKTKKVVMSRVRLEVRDTDFLERYSGMYPFFYDVNVCPNCGYAAMDRQFDKLTPEQKKIIRSEVQEKWIPKDFGGERSIQKALNAYKLALYVSELKKDAAYVKASILHRIAWIYRIDGDKESENKFITYAIKYYTMAYERDNVNQIKVAYIIGDLYRRLENKAEAIKWFNIVITDPMKERNQLIVEMAREGWQACRNE
ncbi:hypothetical protein SAMN02746089_00082 [Caldanaerobius fijiensis DSM 17918]|uniref:Tetratricopeptide repeat-containing protein n=1 Tax=Caldanaerobius fijiensis DSM 17918 TaxID=1121256 RepID=A0A1M4SN56_9THEO|nr:DUF2225 domain-containing protein [Caldanaerobius fijiensis]SHE33631.1 hypothetical protein SAMN02746089_00082 [Caldanaerobius fijiensis DSM 17918]